MSFDHLKLARGGVEAIQDAGGTEGVYLAVSECRRGSRAGAAECFVESCLVFVRPEFFARAGVNADNGFLAAALLLGEDAARDNGERGPTGADAPSPEKFRRRLVPVRGDANAMYGAVGVGAAETRPIVRSGGERIAGGIGKFRLLFILVKTDALGEEPGFARGRPAPVEDGLVFAAEALHAYEITGDPGD